MAPVEVGRSSADEGPGSCLGGLAPDDDRDDAVPHVPGSCGGESLLVTLDPPSDLRVPRSPRCGRASLTASAFWWLTAGNRYPTRHDGPHLVGQGPGENGARYSTWSSRRAGPNMAQRALATLSGAFAAETHGLRDAFAPSHLAVVRHLRPATMRCVKPCAVWT